MLTISFINDSTSDVKKKSEIEQALQYTFRYVNHGEVSVIFDVESPTSTLGKSCVSLELVISCLRILI